MIPITPELPPLQSTPNGIGLVWEFAVMRYDWPLDEVQTLGDGWEPVTVLDQSVIGNGLLLFVRRERTARRSG